MSLIGIKTPQEIVEEQSIQLEVFLNYVGDMGIVVQLHEIMAKDVSSVFGANLIDDALTDIENTEAFHLDTFDAVTLAGAAVSFEFLVRHIRKLDPTVMPPTIIPDPTVVKALLDLFHEKQQRPPGSN